MDFVLFAITCFNRSAICSFYYFKRKCFNGTIQNHGYYTFGKPRVKPRGKLWLATTLNHGLLQFWQTKIMATTPVANEKNRTSAPRPLTRSYSFGQLNHDYYTFGKLKKKSRLREYFGKLKNKITATTALAN